MTPLRFIFIIQGEGRGHMTQALAMHQILTDAGHEIGAVFIGKNKKREIPSYFLEKINSPTFLLKSPYFATDTKNKSIKIGATITQNIPSIPSYLQGLALIHREVKSYRPDIILNFYDILGGLYRFIYRPKAKSIAIAHQFLAAHPEFPFAEGSYWDKKAYLLLNYLTGFGASDRLCLSFQPYSPQPGITIVPPLLRKEIKNLVPVDGNYIHGYLLNDGYSHEVIRWHEAHPDVPLYFFWDKKDATQETVLAPNLVFHTLDDAKFLQKMAQSKAYVSTAGFESICEAMYLGKPLMVVPVEGHYEQACNARDAVKAGAGITSKSFDLGLLLDYLPHHKSITDSFRTWADSAGNMMLAAMEKVAKEK